MTTYEYFLQAILIVLGLTLSSLLAGVFDLVNRRSSISFHWVPAVWILSSLLFFTHFFYVGYQARCLEWEYSHFILMLVSMITLYGMAALMLPPSSESHPDMLEHFLKTGPLALGFFAITMLLLIPVNYYILGKSQFDWLEASAVPAIPFILLILGVVFRTPFLRGAIALCFLLFSVLANVAALLKEPLPLC